MTLNNAREGLDILKTALQAVLDADATFATYGGADVVLLDDEPAEAESVGRPYIVLDIESDGRSEDGGPGARDAVIGADVVAGEYSGARTGVANPVGSDTLLSAALHNFMRDNYAVLRDAGLYRNRIEQGRGRIQQSETEAAEHRDPHRIFFTYFTP